MFCDPKQKVFQHYSVGYCSCLFALGSSPSCKRRLAIPQHQHSCFPSQITHKSIRLLRMIQLWCSLTLKASISHGEGQQVSITRINSGNPEFASISSSKYFNEKLFSKGQSSKITPALIAQFFARSEYGTRRVEPPSCMELERHAHPPKYDIAWQYDSRDITLTWMHSVCEHSPQGPQH
jgi:hypothetical protein